MTSTFVTELVAAYPEIREVWLIGSRANGTARPDSDWDYLVFGNDRILRSLARRNHFNRADIDLLIVYNGNQFKKPWTDGKRRKSGSLKEWLWEKRSQTMARYRAVKGIHGEEFNVDVKCVEAQRVWPPT